MLRISIVEDNLEEQKLLEGYIKEYFDIKMEKVRITCFQTAESFKVYRSNAAKEAGGFQEDLLFLDIELPDQSGMELAIELRKSGEELLIVFTTRMVQYAVSGYDVSATDFLVKPFEKEIFFAKLKKYIGKCKKKRQFIHINNKNGVYRISISDILYIESLLHKIIIHTRKGDLECSSSLKNFEKELEGNGFAMCNKCYLVNLRHVDSVIDDKVSVGGNLLQASRRGKRPFLEALAAYEGDI